MTESKEWVTIKIPKSVRSDAKDDPRTYEEIMRAGLVFDIDPNTLERFRELKGELDDKQEGPNSTVDTFLWALMDTWNAVDSEKDTPVNYGERMDVDAEEVANQVVDEIDSLAFQGAMTDSEADRIIGHIKDLETEIKTTLEGLR
jgi:hypothetical protein